MKLFLLILFCVTLLCASAQSEINAGVVRGNITNAETREPIPYAEVFISGTTVGCITDTQGNYELKVPFLPCTLVADHVAYESFITVLQNYSNALNITLSPTVIPIHEVQVSSKNRRKHNLRYFYSRFIHENRNKIEILNDSVLVFERTEMEFKASTIEPLLIINHLLGYKIKLLLEQFTVYSVDGPAGKRVPLVSLKGGDIIQVTGYYFYEELESESLEKIRSYRYNRRLNYYGSLRHFLKSIYDNNPEEQGFQVEAMPPRLLSPFVENEPINTFSGVKYFRIEADSVEIYYHFDDDKYPVSKEEIPNRNYVHRSKSMIYPDDETSVVRSNGTSPKLGFIVNGLMTKRSLVNSLPEDYLPPQKNESHKSN